MNTGKLLDLILMRYISVGEQKLFFEPIIDKMQSTHHTLNLFIYHVENGKLHLKPENTLELKQALRVIWDEAK